MRQVWMIVAAMLAGQAQGNAWSCRNPDMEIGCGDGQCHVTLESGFTPMSIAFSDDGALDLCIYSGCWAGSGTVTGNGRFLAILATDLVFSTDPEAGEQRADAAILFDTHDEIALLRIGGFAQPLVCRPITPGAPG